jgi:hypothetical protein
MNPAKGKGERYIYCQHEAEGDCLAVVARKGWEAFNCERCEFYLKSETYREKKMDSPVKPENDEYNEHISDGGQGMEGKKLCNNCLEEKPIEAFAKNPGCRDGREGQCRTCRAAKNKKRALEKKGGEGSSDRIQKLKESAERVKKIRSQKSEDRNQNEDLTIKTRKKAVFADDSRKVFGAVAVVEDPVSADIVPSPAFNVEKMEDQNRADVKIFARAFVAGLKSELISAMTEQISGQTQGSAPTGNAN